VERDYPRVFPRPDILTLRTTNLGELYVYRPPPPYNTGTCMQSNPGRLSVSSAEDVWLVAS
jgi:hypothetical protein